LIPDANEIPSFQIVAILFNNSRRDHAVFAVFHARTISRENLAPDFVFGVMLGDGEGQLLADKILDNAADIPLGKAFGHLHPDFRFVIF